MIFHAPHLIRLCKREKIMSNYADPKIDGVHMHLENKKVGKNFFVFLWMMYALVYMTKYCFSAAMAPIVEAGVLTKSQTGFIAAAFHIVYAPLQILGGMFADRYNPEKMIKIGLLGSTIANLVIFINQNYFVMLAAWMFNAATQFAIWPSVFKIVASQLPRSEKPRFIFLMSFSATFGLFLSYLVAAILPAWQMNFAVSSVISLLLLIAMCIVCNKVDRFMLPDKEVQLDNIKERSECSISMKKLAVKSGLILLVVVSFIRCMLGQGTQTIAPTMLMESYESISASIGNMLSTIIIFSGIAGSLVVKFIFYPKIIKNEVVGIVATFSLIIPMCVILCMVGSLPAWVIIMAMSVISFCTSAGFLFLSYYNASFAAVGKDGVVAGLLNSAASIAIIAQSYGFAAIADNFGWIAVTKLWVVLGIIAMVLTIIALPIYNKFKKEA